MATINKYGSNGITTLVGMASTRNSHIGIIEYEGVSFGSDFDFKRASHYSPIVNDNCIEASRIILSAFLGRLSGMSKVNNLNISYAIYSSAVDAIRYKDASDFMMDTVSLDKWLADNFGTTRLSEFCAEYDAEIINALNNSIIPTSARTTSVAGDTAVIVPVSSSLWKHQKAITKMAQEIPSLFDLGSGSSSTRYRPTLLTGDYATAIEDMSLQTITVNFRDDAPSIIITPNVMDTRSGVIDLGDLACYPYIYGETHVIGDDMTLLQASDRVEITRDIFFHNVVSNRLGTNPLDAFCSNYEVTRGTLEDLSRFMWNTDFTTMIETIGVNPKDCIISITAYPFTVKAKSSTNSRIILGNFIAQWLGSEIHGKKLTDFKDEFDFGTIEVPHVHYSFIDYKPYASAYMYLPFVGTVPIDVNIIIGNKIHVKYFVEYMTGTCLVEVYVSDGKILNDTLILQTSGTIGMKLPITSADHSTLVETMTSAVTGALSGAFHGGGKGAIAGGIMGAVNGVFGGNTDVTIGGCAGNTGFLGELRPFLVLNYSNTMPSASSNAYRNSVGIASGTVDKLYNHLGDYVELDGVKVDDIPDLTDNERKELEEILTSGFYV